MPKFAASGPERDPLSQAIIVVAPGLELPAFRGGLDVFRPRSDSGSHPLQTIGEAISKRRRQSKPLGELHLVAHANGNGIQLGDQWINTQTLDRFAPELTKWQIDTLVLWCCEIGNNKTFLTTLEKLTSADVFATPKRIDRNTNYVTNRSNTTHNLTELIGAEALRTWDGNLSWMQLNDSIEGYKKNIQTGAAIALSSDGNRFITGASKDWAPGKRQGSAFVYERNGTGWSQLGNKIKGENKQDLFGNQVSMSADGGRVAISAIYGDNSPYIHNSGNVRVFELSGDTWTQLGETSDIKGNWKNQRLGKSIALSGDGNTIITTAVRHHTRKGYSKIHRWTGTKWEQVGSNIVGTQKREESGKTSAISYDGTVVAIGSTEYQNPDETGKQKVGRVKVFELSNGDWVQRGADIIGDVKNGKSGWSISLSDDGNTLAVGAPFANNDSGYTATYHFNETETDNSQKWEKSATLDGTSNSYFGGAVDLSGDGSTLVVSANQANGDNGTHSGTVFVYELADNRNDAGERYWEQLGQSIEGEAKQNRLGMGPRSIAISSDGSTIALGSQQHDGATGADTGQVRVFTKSGLTITQTGTTSGDHLLTTEASDSSSFSVVLNAQPTDDIVVNITGGDASEFLLSSSSLTFTTSNWETPQTVTVTGVDDNSIDGNITTTLTATASNTGGFLGTEQASTTVITTDNEVAGITIAQASTPLVTTEAGSTASFTVVLDAKPTDNVTVAITGDDSTEHQLSASSLTFTASNWNTAQTVTVTGVDDSLDDGDITTTITATASNTGGYAGTETATATLKTSDDDTAGITIAQASTPLVTTEAGTTASFTVVLDAKPTDNVTVSITGADDTEHSLSSSSLTFTTSNWNTAQTVTVTGVDDNLDDGDITTTITATASNTGGYAGTETATATLQTTDDDTAGITIAQASTPLVTTEAGTTASFTVVLDAKPTDNVTVSITGNDSTEHQLSSSSLTFTTSNWNTAQTVTVTGVDDNLDDGDITTTLTATASNTGGYAGTETATATLKTTDDDSSGITIAQASSPLVTTEAGSTASFTVVLDNKPTDNVTVSITGADDTEHSLSSSSLTFTTSNWNTAQTVTVTGVDDNLDDGDITTTLTATASNSGGFTGSEAASITVMTTDDDTAGVTIAQASSPLVTTEAGSTASFTVVLDAKPTDNVTVSITGNDSTEHQLSSSSLTFTTSNWNTAQTVTVSGVDDNLDDGDITTTLTATASNTGGYAGTETATATLKTTDDDIAGITIAQASTPLVTTEAGSTASFTVVLDAKPTDNVTVSITGNDSTEHQLSSSSLTFTASNWNTAQTVTVTGVDDSLDDGDITTTITATASNTGGYAGTETATATLQTTDDDTAGITIAQASTPLVTTEAGTTASFTVVLDAKPTDNVTVSITGDDSTEHQLSASSLTFTASNWNTAQTVTVTGVDDSLDDGDITTTITATASNTGGYAGTETATATLKTSDDDTAGITIAQASTPLVTTEAGTTASFTVVLDAKPTDNVTVSITGADDTEHSLSSSSLTFTASNWNTAQTVTVTGVDDSIVDGDITTTLTATASNTGGYAGTETATATLKTTDNDTAGITIAQASSPLVTTEAGSTASFTVVLDNKPTDNVTVSITGNDSTEHQLSSSSLTFTASNWNTAQTVTVTGVDDSIVDGDITTTLTATASNTGGYAGTETATATLKTSDNDNPPAITDQSKSELETLAGGSEILDLADSNSGNDTDQDGDAISYSITDGNSANFFTIGETTGKILLATGQSLDHDTSDLHTLEITASSTGGSTTAKVEINVLDVNNAPVAADDSGSINENATLSRTEAQGLILNNDSDADSDALTISQFHAGTTDADSPRIGQFNTSLEGDYGTLTLQTNGSFNYVADQISADALQAGEIQDDVFSYTLSDGKDIDTAELTISVAGVNDQPFLIDAIKTKKYTEGQINVPLIIDGSLDIRDVDDSNIESATVSISSTTFVSTEDTLAFNNAYGISGNWNSSSGVLTLSGSATKANYINALQTVTYTNTNTSDPQGGARAIAWQVNDGDANSTAIESNIIVLGQNDAPEANNDTASVDGGSTVATQTNLLANDTDPEGHSRSITSFRIGSEQQSNAGFSPGATITGSYGKMTIQSDGTYSYQAQETAAYKLLAGETATETYTYTITDSQTVDEGIDSGEITITITGVNDSPTAIDDTAKINEDSSKQFEDHLGILKNDTDIDGDQLYIKSVRAGAETSSRSLNTGTDSSPQSSTLKTKTQNNETVSETQSDSSGKETSSEGLDTENQNNESNSETQSESSLTKTSGKTSDTEIQKKETETGTRSSSVDSLSTEIKGTYGNLIVNPNGSYRYTANLADALDSGDKEIDRFTYTLTDLSSDDSAEMAIEVTGINDAPVLAAVTAGTIADQANSSSLVSNNISGRLSATDADASAVLNYGISGNSGSTASGNYGTLSLNRSTGAYEYIPTTAVIEALNQGDSVSDSFELFVSDGSLSSTRTFQVNITGANDASGGGGGGSENNNSDRTHAKPSQLISNNDGSGFRVTGSSGVWVQLEVLRNNSDWQNSLQIISADGQAIGSIGATRRSSNMGVHELFLSSGSEIRFHQSSHNQKLNQSPSLQIIQDIDNSFLLHLEDNKNQGQDYDDLSIKITTSRQSKNINTFKLASEQRHINDPILNLTDLQPGATKLRLTLNSDCGDTSRVAFVKLTSDDVSGFTVDGIASTDGRAFEQAVRDSLINPDNTEILMNGERTRTVEWTLDQKEGGFYAPVFINQVTNHLVTYGMANSLKGEHYIKNLGSNFFGYEDTLSAQESDWDFNDITMLVEMI